MSSIHAMNLAGIDLNLLVVFDALMVERQVTRAGERIGLSQPATSNALARLRNLTKDELFIITSGGLQPTPVAVSLARQIQPALNQIQAALSSAQPFDPKTSDLIFNIGMSDYVELVLLPEILERIETAAPHIKIQIKSGDRQHQMALLDRGEIDLLCGLIPDRIPWHERQLLFREQFVCLCRSDRQFIGDTISLEEYVNASHLLVSVQEDMMGRVDYILSKQNLSRHIALSIPHFMVAPSILARTNLIATLPARVANEFTSNLNLKVLPCPIPLKGFAVYMRWHQSNQNNATHIWLRTLIQEIAKTID
jgi:DNA-binding transcriptional LysR family regulator